MSACVECNGMGVRVYPGTPLGHTEKCRSCLNGESICLSPPRGLHCAPLDGKAVHPHSDDTWWFHDETWMDEYGPYLSQEEAEQKCKEYAAQL